MKNTVQMFTVRIPLHVRKRGGRKTMIAPDMLAMPARQDITLVTFEVAPSEAERLIVASEHARLYLVLRNPNDPDLLIDRSGILHGVGRLNDSVTDARRALELDPLTPDVRANYIYTLAGSGRLDAALEQLSEADKLWPGSSSVQRTRAIVHNRYGDPKLALQMLRLSGGQSQSGAAETFLQARIDPSASNVARALEDARSAYRRSPDALVHLIQVLNQFDRQDELLALMARVPLSEQARLADLFFRPAAREFWRDPRSLSYAKRIGLLKYWSSSGKWPDFCFERQQSYDCRAEAKKLQ